jgi:hypothetical protein
MQVANLAAVERLKKRNTQLKLLLCFFGGVIFFLVGSLFGHSQVYRSALESRRPTPARPFNPADYVIQFWTNPFVIFISFLWCTYVAIVNRGKPESWVCAFLSGNTFVFLFFYLLLGRL